MRPLLQNRYLSYYNNMHTIFDLPQFNVLAQSIFWTNQRQFPHVFFQLTCVGENITNAPSSTNNLMSSLLRKLFDRNHPLHDAALGSAGAVDYATAMTQEV
mmetsp:Transcript_29529/g.71306  ORF Transcript_29529/g.71306 Transcript_29529/m.71306 type:complete len:101 (-) Transcript_29529:4659-4961(-)